VNTFSAVASTEATTVELNQWAVSDLEFDNNDDTSYTAWRVTLEHYYKNY